MTILDFKNGNFNPDNIPDDLKTLRQWVVWRGEQRGKKTSKFRNARTDAALVPRIQTTG
jgi:primase-polymerase (primpol)-like protein